MLTKDGEAFIKGQIKVMQRRLDKAIARVEKSEGTNLVEAERVKRLTKLIELHKTDPEAALDHYKSL